MTDEENVRVCVFVGASKLGWFDPTKSTLYDIGDQNGTNPYKILDLKNELVKWIVTLLKDKIICTQCFHCW